MKKITMYTGPLCNYCEAAKRLLTRNNAPYNEIDYKDRVKLKDLSSLAKKQLALEEWN